MIKKIILLRISSFNQRDYKRFGIELLKRDGFEVEVWDLTNSFFPYIAKTYTPPDQVNWAGHKVFKDKHYAIKNLQDLSSDVFVISFLPYNREFYSIYKAISASNAKYASFCANVQPLMKTSKKEKLGESFFTLNNLKDDPFNKLLNYIFQKLPHPLLGLKPASLILAGGTESLRHQFPVDLSEEILWIHTLDYDLYLEEKNKPFTEKPIAVFLDEYLPFHLDFFRAKIPPPIEPDKYYPYMNKFFTLLEEKLRLEVMIAAHPSSHHEKLSVFFEGRNCIHGHTIKLTKESKLVLAHSSTSLNFANLFYKPMIFLTSSELDKNYKGPLIRETAKIFGKKPIYIDRDNYIDWNFECTVSELHYKNYRKSYIKTENSEESPFWQIVANRLKKEF